MGYHFECKTPSKKGSDFGGLGGTHPLKTYLEYSPLPPEMSCTTAFFQNMTNKKGKRQIEDLAKNSIV